MREENPNSMWYVDSGASQHMCHELEGFVKYIKRHGDVNIKLTNGDEKIIRDILYIPRLAKNLFFVKQLDKRGGEICIRGGTTTLINKFGQTIGICKLNPNLYKLGTTILLNKHQITIPTTTQLNKADL
uniref:Retrovirus-related Pol polyprotein from transposon TNT 1-94-like beta-barrel domain-containing protein n=1 Tax=Physcomitrium patens TaxID=3218 RepID=A0A2K1K9Y7_PHYPA|nr:hypothetical protein PHYPA_009774 [Physcomitrium patens]